LMVNVTIYSIHGSYGIGENHEKSWWTSGFLGLLLEAKFTQLCNPAAARGPCFRSASVPVSKGFRWWCTSPAPKIETQGFDTCTAGYNTSVDARRSFFGVHLHCFFCVCEVWWSRNLFCCLLQYYN
jgi:hypothetical protein